MVRPHSRLHCCSERSEAVGDVREIGRDVGHAHLGQREGEVCLVRENAAVLIPLRVERRRSCGDHGKPADSRLESVLASPVAGLFGAGRWPGHGRSASPTSQEEGTAEYGATGQVGPLKRLWALISSRRVHFGIIARKRFGKKL